MSNVHNADGAAGSDSSVLADLIDGLTAKMQAGEPIDWEGVARQYPQHADEIIRLRPALGLLGELSKSGPAELSGIAAPAVAEESLATGVLGDFRIVREVGRGAMGVVYEAEQVSLGRRVALKVLPFAATMDVRALQRFQNEARAAACLHHTNVVPVYYVGCERGIHFYAMQFIDGQTLADLIRELRRPAGQAPGPEERTTAHTPAEGVVAPKVDTEPAARQSTRATQSAAMSREFFRRAAGWGIQAAEALDHAHQAAIVHRDIKPGNLLLDGRGQLWVADFGLAHVRQGEAGLTMTGDLVGTLRYMSPEQALAKRVPIDHRTDVYSLGATLYELLTLRPVLSGKDRQELLRQIAFEEPTPPHRLNKAIPHELEIIVLKAMEKNPTDRYATAQEMADDLRRFLDDKPIRARRPPLTAQLARWGRRHTALVGALTAALVAAIAVLGGSVGWVVRDKANRSAETARVVGQALDESVSWQQQRRLPEAQSAARRAAGLVVGGEADEALRKRIEARSADLELLNGLENARLEMTTVKGGKYDKERADDLYGTAFRTYGLDIATLPPEEAGEHLRRSSVAAEAAALLDHWAMIRRPIRGPEDASWKRIIGVARAADPDAWRDSLREAMERMDGPALEKLARSDEVFDLLPATLGVLADALNAGGATERAEALLREAQRRRPDDFWANNDLAFALVNQSHPPRTDEAIRFFTAALALRPQSAGVHNDLGNALNDEQQLDEAIQEFRRAIELGPKEAVFHTNLGHALHDKKQLDEAIQEHRRAIELDPNFALAHNNLGVALLAKQQLDEAIQEFRRAIELDSKYAPTHNGLGLALYDKGQLDEAIQEFHLAIELDPKDAATHNNLGNVLKDKRLLDEAIQEFRRAIELDPKDARTHNNLGVALIAKHQPDEAILEFRRAFELDPKLDGPHNGLGLALYDKQQLDEAIQEYRRAIELNNKNPQAHNNLGNALKDKQRPDEAILEYRRSIALDPKFAEPHNGLGSALNDKQQGEDAIQEYRQAIELDPKIAQFHYNLGLALYAKGQLDKAIQEYRRAIELDPNLAIAHHNLGFALHDKQRLDEAIQEYRRSIALDPNFAPAHHNLGNALKDKQQLDAAIQEYRRAIELAPKVALPRRGLADALYAKQQLDEAIQEYRRAIELDNKNALTHYNLGVALKDKRQWDEAIQEYRRTIELDPNYAQAHCNLGSVLRETGKLTESLDAYRKGHRLGSGQPGWPFPSAQWVQLAELLVKLDHKLAAILEGKEKPADDDERLALAQLCQQPFKKLYAASSRFFTEAFAHDAKLADDMQAQPRYNAACSAALAGCGRGADAPVAVADRALLRAQALKWLQADMAAWKPQTKSLFPAVRTRAVNALAHWREDDDLAGVRGDDSLAKLPEAERDAWRQLWTDLDALLAKAKP